MNVNLYISNSEPLSNIEGLTVDPRGVVLSRIIEGGASLPQLDDSIRFNLYADRYDRTTTIECRGVVTTRFFNFCHSEPTLELHITLNGVDGKLSPSEQEALRELANFD